MKRLLCICISLVLLIFSTTVAAHAADSYLELNGFTFDVNENGEATIHDYDDSSTDVTIPNKLLRAPVVYIDDYAFYGKSMSSLDLTQAAGLVHIGNCAFCGCSSLEELFLPSNVALSFGAFQGCSGLEALTIDNGIDTIPEQCFYNCSSLTEIALPDSVTTIEIRAFGNCTDLRYAYLSDNIESIADNAFINDSKLTIRCNRGSYAAQYAKENHIPVEYPITYMLGDADGDEDISVCDATVFLRVMADIMPDPDGLICLRSSINGDPEDLTNATILLRYLANIEVPYPVGEIVSGYTAAEFDV